MSKNIIEDILQKTPSISTGTKTKESPTTPEYVALKPPVDPSTIRKDLNIDYTAVASNKPLTPEIIQQLLNYDDVPTTEQLDKAMGIPCIEYLLKNATKVKTAIKQYISDNKLAYTEKPTPDLTQHYQDEGMYYILYESDAENVHRIACDISNHHHLYNALTRRPKLLEQEVPLKEILLKQSYSFPLSELISKEHLVKLILRTLSLALSENLKKQSASKFHFKRNNLSISLGAAIFEAIMLLNYIYAPKKELEKPKVKNMEVIPDASSQRKKIFEVPRKNIEELKS